MQSSHSPVLFQTSNFNPIAETIKQFNEIQLSLNQLELDFNTLQIRLKLSDPLSPLEIEAPEDEKSFDLSSPSSLDDIIKHAKPELREIHQSIISRLEFQNYQDACDDVLRLIFELKNTFNQASICLLRPSTPCETQVEEKLRYQIILKNINILTTLYAKIFRDLYKVKFDMIAEINHLDSPEPEPSLNIPQTSDHRYDLFTDDTDRTNRSEEDEAKKAIALQDLKTKLINSPFHAALSKNDSGELLPTNTPVPLLDLDVHTPTNSRITPPSRPLTPFPRSLFSSERKSGSHSRQHSSVNLQVDVDTSAQLIDTPSSIPSHSGLHSDTSETDKTRKRSMSF